MSDVESQIRELNKLLDESIEMIDELNKQLILHKNDYSDIQQKDQKLQEVENKLKICQKERDKINEQLGQKIEELNISNLDNQEKAKQITEIMVGDYAKLKVACSSLTKTLNNWIETKQKVSELLRIKEERSREAVLSLEKTKQRQWIIIGVLSVVVILLSLSLSLSLSYCYKKTKKKIIK